MVENRTAHQENSAVYVRKFLRYTLGIYATAQNHRVSRRKAAPAATGSEFILLHLAARTREVLAASRIVNIIAPRQCGKSTMVEHQVPIAQYLTMVDPLLRTTIESNPYQMLSDHAARNETGKPMAIGEVQRVPDITLALKRIVDQNRAPGQFPLTGSSDIFTMAKPMTRSPAGSHLHDCRWEPLKRESRTGLVRVSGKFKILWFLSQGDKKVS